MKEREGFSLLSRVMDQYAKETELHKEAKRRLQEYEASYRNASLKLTELANTTLTTWEEAHRVLKQQNEQDISAGLIGNAVERLEGFLLEIKPALTYYRRRKAEPSLRFTKAGIDLTQWHKGKFKQQVTQEVRAVETVVSELVKDATGRANMVLQYLRDIQNEAEATHKALQRKVERVAPPHTQEPTGVLQTVHERLKQTRKIAVSYSDFASSLEAGNGGFHFIGKQADLAYLLLFLNRNGFALNWKNLNFSYMKNGVPAKTTVQSLKDAQKKFSIRNEPEIKPMLAGFKEKFPELIIP